MAGLDVNSRGSGQGSALGAGCGCRQVTHSWPPVPARSHVPYGTAVTVHSAPGAAPRRHHGSAATEHHRGDARALLIGM